MSERDIFAAARDRINPADRELFLNKACAGDTALRHRIERLLVADAAADSILDMPVVQVSASGDSVTGIYAASSADVGDGDTKTIARATGDTPKYAETKSPDEGDSDFDLKTLLSPAQEEGSIGRLDHYEVLGVVGRGGMGVVLKAHDTKLRRIVAVKLLSPALSAVPTARRRFAREAQAAAAVRDDHVVDIHAVCEDRPVPYIVMDFVSGITLEERFRTSGALQTREVLQIGAQSAKGLAAAHAQGLIHRDVKPGNILLEDGVQRVKLTDFGLARAADDASISRSGIIAGTPLYMSPEQARGDKIDSRSDLFSLGSVLYTLCTGRPAFRAGNSVAVIRRVCKDDPRPIRDVNPDIPKWLCAVIEKLMAKEPADRIQSASEVADLFTRYLAHLEDPDRVPPPPPVKGVRVSVRRRLRKPAIAALAATVAITIGLVAYQASQSPNNSSAPNTKADEPDQFPVEEPIAKLTPVTPDELSARPSPLDGRKREQIPTRLLGAAVNDQQATPTELIAMLGDTRFRLPPRQTATGTHCEMRLDREGKWLAVPFGNGVAIFDARTGELAQTVTARTDKATKIALSPDGRSLAVAGEATAPALIQIFDVQTGKETASLQGAADALHSLLFAGDSKQLFSLGARRLDVWDIPTSTIVQTIPLTGGASSSYSLGLSSDGKKLAWGESPKNVAVWEIGSDKPPASMSGHTAGILYAAFSADGKWLATGNNNELVLWDAVKLQQIKKIDTAASWLAFEPGSKSLLSASCNSAKNPNGYIVTRWDLGTYQGQALPALHRMPGHAQLSPDGKTLYVQFGDNSEKEWRVRTFNAATGMPLTEQVQSGDLSTVAVSPDGRLFATGGVDRSIQLWDLAGWKQGVPQPPVRSLNGHAGTIFSVAFSPDSKLVASGSHDGTIRLWNATTGENVRTLKGETSKASTDVAFSADGKFVAVGSSDGSIRLWDVASGEGRSPLRWHTQHVNSLAFSADKRFLASVGLSDRKVHITDLKTFRRTQSLGPAGNAKGSWQTKVAFSGDGKILAYGGWDDTIRLWDMAAKTETSLTGAVPNLNGLALDLTGHFVVATAGGSVRFWDRNIPNNPVVIGPGQFGTTAHSIAFTPEGRYLVVAGSNGTVSILRTPTPALPYSPGSPLKLPSPFELAKRSAPVDALIKQPGMAAMLGETRFRLPNESVSSWMAQDKEGKWLAVPHGNSVAIFDARTGVLASIITGPNGRWYTVAISRDGNYIAGGFHDADHTVKVWDLKSGKESATLKGHTGNVWCVIFSPDDKHLISAADDSVKLWDFKKGEEIRTLEAHAYRLSQVAMSPDKKKIACCDHSSKMAKVFDADTGAELASLPGHTTDILAAAFSADGKLLATGSDTEVLIWSADTWELIKKIESPAGWLAFDPDGKTLLTAKHDQNGPDRDHVVTRWDLKQFEGDPLPSLSDRSGWPVFQLSPDGKTLYSMIVDGADRERQVRVYDAITGKESLRSQGHTGQALAVASSSDGKLLASAGQDGTVRIWDMATGKQRHVITRPGKAVAVAFAPDGKSLAAYWRDGPIVVLDPTTATELWSVPNPGELLQVAFSQDSKQIAAGASNGAVYVWNARSADLVRTLNAGAGPAWAVEFSPDGKLLATGSEAGTTGLWDVASGWQVGKLPNHNGAIKWIGFHPDGRSVAITVAERGSGNFSSVTKLETDAILGPESPKVRILYGTQPKEYLSKSHSISLTAGQQYQIVMTSLDENLVPKLYLDVNRTGKGLRSAIGNTASRRASITVIAPVTGSYRLTACAESGEGRYELTLSTIARSTAPVQRGLESNVVVYDLATGKETNRFTANGIAWGAWRADGQMLFTPGDDGMLRAWNMGDGLPAGVVPLNTGLQGYALTPDGRHLAAAGQDGTIGVFQLAQPGTVFEPGAPENDQAAATLAQAYQAKLKDPQWTALKPTEMKSEGGATLTLQNDDSILVSGNNPNRDAYTLVCPPNLRRITAIKLETLPDPSLKNFSGRAPGNGNFALSEWKLAIVSTKSGEAPRSIQWKDAWSDHRVEAAEHYRSIAMHIGLAIDGNPQTYWENWPKSGTAHWAIFLPETPIHCEGEAQLKFTLQFQAIDVHNLGRFRISVTDDPVEPQNSAASKSVDPWLRLAIAYFQRGQNDEASRYFSKAMQRADGFEARKRILEVAANYDLDLSALAGQLPDDLQVQAALARRHAVHGKTLLAEKQPAKAQAELEKALEIYTRLRLPDDKWKVLAPVEMKSKNGAKFDVQKDGSIFVYQVRPIRNDIYSLVFDSELKGISGLRLEAIPDSRLPYGGPGWGDNGNFHLSELTLQAAPAGSPDAVKAIALRNASASFSEVTSANGGTDVRGAIDGDTKTAWAIFPRVNQNHVAVFDTVEKIGNGQKTRLSVEFKHTFSGQDHNLGCFRLSFTDDPATLQATRLRWDLNDNELVDCHLALGKAYGEQRLTKQAIESFIAAFKRAPDQTGKVKVIEAAVSMDGILPMLAEANSSDGLLHAELARQFAAQGNAPMAEAARSKARILLEKNLENEPDHARTATELADLIWSTITPFDHFWIDDATPPGANLQGDTPWEFVGAPDHPVFRGAKSMRRQAMGLSQHYFDSATSRLKIGEGAKLFAYVYLDPKDPPKTLMLQFNNGNWEHRAIWGEDLIPFGTGGKENHLLMGPLPKAGEWVRLEVDVGRVGLHAGMVLNGWAFTQHSGTCYWDAAGISNYFENPWQRLAVAYLQLGDQKAFDKLVHLRPSAVTAIGDLYAAHEEWDRAIAEYEKLRTSYPTNEAPLAQLAGVYQRTQKLDKAIPLMAEILKLRKSRLGPDHPETVEITNALAQAYLQMNQFDQALPLFEQVLKSQEAKNGRSHPETRTMIANLGAMYLKADRFKEAIPLLEECQVNLLLLQAYAKVGENTKFVKIVQAASAEARSLAPDGGLQLASNLAVVGLHLLKLEKWSEAEPLIRESLDIREKLQPNDWSTFNAKSMLGGALLGQKKYTEAEPLLVQGYEGMKQNLKTIPELGKDRFKEALDRLINLYAATNKSSELEKWQIERANYPEVAPMPREKN